MSPLKSFLSSTSRIILHRVFHQLADLGLVDLDLGCTLDIALYVGLGTGTNPRYLAILAVNGTVNSSKWGPNADLHRVITDFSRYIRLTLQ